MPVTTKYDQKPPSKPFSWAAVRYPHLGVAAGSGLVVLFLAEGDGVVLYPGSDFYRVGARSPSWRMQFFTPLVGGITLENKNY